MASLDTSRSSSDALLKLAQRVKDYAAKPVDGDDAKLAAEIGAVVKGANTGAQLRSAIGFATPQQKAAQKALDQVVARNAFLQAFFKDTNDGAEIAKLGFFKPTTRVPQQRAGDKAKATPGGAVVSGDDVHEHFDTKGPSAIMEGAQPAAVKKGASAKAKAPAAPIAPPVVTAADAAAHFENQVEGVAPSASDTAASFDGPAAVDSVAKPAEADAIPPPQAVGPISANELDAPKGDSIAQPTIDGELPSPGVMMRRSLATIQAQINGDMPEFMKVHEAKFNQLEKFRLEIKAAGEACAAFEKKPANELSPEQDLALRRLKADRQSFAEQAANFNKADASLSKVTNLRDVTAAFYGYYSKLAQGKSVSLDNESKEGQHTIAAIDRLTRGTESPLLTPDEVGAIDEFRANATNRPTIDEVKGRLEVFKQFAEAANASNIPPTQQKLVNDQVCDALMKFCSTNDERELHVAVDAIKNAQAAFANQASGAAAQPGPAPGATQAQPGAAPAQGAPGTIDPDIAAANKAAAKTAATAAGIGGFGLSKARRGELMKMGQEDLVAAIDQYHQTLNSYHMKSASRLAAMRGILTSGMPIEAILVLFMALMTENEEDKLKLKMLETTVAEGFERANRKIETDRVWARDLLKKCRATDGLPPEYREKIDLAKLSAMAGERQVKGIDSKEAAEIRATAASWEKRLYGDPPDPTLSQHDLEELRLEWPKDVCEAQQKQMPTPATFVYDDLQLNPADYGFTTKSSQTLTQEMQAQSQAYKQMIETFTSVLRMLQDMVNKIITNIR